MTFAHDAQRPGTCRRCGQRLVQHREQNGAWECVAWPRSITRSARIAGLVAVGLAYAWVAITLVQAFAR